MLAHSDDIQHPKYELLEAQNNEWLDNGKTSTSGATNQAMATMAT